ncbi:MAG: hypothetical protein JXB19_09800 [Bacteroidales bacterium]|nr:hypothetical protein [Bacteroidales bacterium]
MMPAIRHFILRMLLGCMVLISSTNFLKAQHNRDLLIDATLHYVLSAEITFASCMFFTLKSPEITLQNKYLASAGIGILAGISKELVDMIHSDGNFDLLDIGMDVLGVGTGLLLHYFIFDKKTVRSNISFNISESGYLASVKVYF